MNPRRMAVEMWPTLVFGGGLVVLVACVGSAENADAVRVVDRLAPSLAANAKAVVVPPQLAASNPAVSSADVAMAAELLAEVPIDVTARERQQAEKPQTVIVATLGDPAEVLPQETAVQTAASAAASVTDPPPPPEAAAAPERVELIGECLVAEACIDQYLFALYERTPKQDTIKEIEHYTVKVRKKGKLRT